jgi:uncharacterized membrane protein YozB (DUF420 family)
MRRSWVLLPLFLVVVAFLIYALPPYLTGDPSRSRIPVAGNVGAYYPLLVAHVVCGAIAMLAACLQIWPWLRARYPDAHRRIGQVYVFAGVLPAGAMGLVLGALTPFGPVLRASNVVLAIVWLTVTLTGYRAGRRFRVADHRRWMIRSVVLTFSIITNRVWAVIWVIALVPQLQTTFGGNEALMVQAIAGLSGWLGWVLPLLAAEWVLDARPGTATVAPPRPAPVV